MTQWSLDWLLKSPLVSDEHDNHVRVGMLPGVFQPRGQVVERVAAGDVVNEKRAGGAAVVRPRDRSERFLPGLEEDEGNIILNDSV